MERNQDGFLKADDGESCSKSVNWNLCLDRVGDVVLTLNSNGLSWKSVADMENGMDCLGFASNIDTQINYPDIYAVELINLGLIHKPILPHTGGCFRRDSKMYRFMVHGFQKSKTQNARYAQAAYIFGHTDVQICQMLVEQINASLDMQVGRPKSLLVFVHPLSGKRNGRRTWETVSPIFSRAKVRTKVMVTERAGHAFDVMTSITDNELSSYDGVVAVGGDGFFNEILNGLLSSRHKAPYPPSPTELKGSFGNIVNDPGQRGSSCSSIGNASFEYVDQNEDQDPLLRTSEAVGSGYSNFRTKNGPFETDQDPVFPIPHERFRFGIIPAGSTDAVVICTTGTRDPVTSALHIVLGKRVHLDIAQVVRWKTNPSSTDAPSVRYAASFAGYGFYGDVITESENYRWMGPKRYDYAGTKVFLKHRSYEAEIAYLDVKTAISQARKTSLEGRTWQKWRSQENMDKVICRVNCPVCKETTSVNSEDLSWLQSKGRFLSVGAAVISCRNERAPDGLVADAHLADGFMNLILIKDCPRALYLWHLTQLARKGGNPLNFEFVEHHKTPAFTFMSSSTESAWNLDGEVFQACQLSAQVFRGLITLFASGPEV